MFKVGLIITNCGASSNKVIVRLKGFKEGQLEVEMKR